MKPGDSAVYTIMHPEDVTATGRGVGEEIPVTLTNVSGNACSFESEVSAKKGAVFARERVPMGFTPERGFVHAGTPRSREEISEAASMIPKADPVTSEEVEESVGDGIPRSEMKQGSKGKKGS